MCWYFLKISSTFEQYRDNTDNRDNFGHYNRDKKFSYRYIPMQRAGPHCTAAHRENFMCSRWPVRHCFQLSACCEHQHVVKHDVSVL